MRLQGDVRQRIGQEARTFPSLSETYRRLLFPFFA